MDGTANDIEKISIIEQEIMVSKLHNMQWLKNTSHSLNLGMTKTICKQKQDRQKQGGNKIKDKVSLMEAIETNSVKESNESHLTMDIYVKDTPKNIEDNEKCMPEEDKNVSNNDLDATNIILKAHQFVTQKIEEENMLNMAVVESIVTAKLEAQCCLNEENKYETEVMSQNNAKDNAPDVCPSISNSQETDQDTKELSLIKHSDDNNNHTKSTILCVSNVQKTTHDNSENSKTLMEAKNNDTCIKKVTSTLKPNIKNEDNTVLPKYNEKPFIPINYKKSVSNQFKPQTTSINKHSKSDRRNSRYVFTTKNDCSKEEESVKQHDVTTIGAENTTKNTTTKSHLMKTSPETELNKTIDAANQCIRKMQNSSNVPLNKDQGLQKQRANSKQFIKGQESFKRNTINRTVDKTKQLEKTDKVTDKVTQTSKNSDLPLNELEKRNEKVIAEKNFQIDQKANRGVNLKRNPTFIAQYKNSTFSKPAQTEHKSMSEDTKNTPINGKNSSYIHNNSISDRERTNNNVERKDGTKVKREYIHTNTKSNIRTEVSTNNLENPIKKQDKVNYTKSKNVKSTNIHDTLTITNNDSINPVKTETHLIENKEFASPSVEQELVTSEQYYENQKLSDNLKVDVDKRRTEINNQMDNKETDSSIHSSNLCSNNCVTRPQANSINQCLLKLEDMQQTDDLSQLGNNQNIWNNDLSSNSMTKNPTIVNTQQSIQNMYLQQNITQAGNQMKQVSPLEMNKFYDQRLAVRDTMQLPQIPNTFDMPSYECNAQATSSNNGITSVLETTIDSNRETSNAPHRYAPNVHQRPFATFPDPVSSQSNRWSPPMQNSFHVEPFVNTAQPPTMHYYNSGAFGPDDFNNAHERNCFPPHQLLYAPCMQTWNPQLQYPLPVYHNSPCANYTMYPGVANQSNNFSDITAVDSMCMHDQQHKFIPYVQVNNNIPNTGPIQMHANPNYVKDTHDCDLSNCTVETRNFDNTPVKFNRYYKRHHQNNYRIVYDVPQYTKPISHPRQQQSFVPARGTHVNQYNAYCPPSQKYYRQNGVNYVQISKSPTSQNAQNFICEDNGLEDIPPIISPKEFVTNNNLSNKTDQFATRVFKSDYKMRPNMGYRQPPMPRYNGGFRRNITYQNIPKEYASSISIGRGVSKKE